MKTTLFYFLFLAVGVMGLNSCSKSSDSVKPAETPITSFLSGTAVSAGVRTSGPWELGLIFSTSVAGKITQLGSKMPEAGSYRVILWDADTKALLRQKTVEQTASDKLALADIEPLTTEANKKYLVSINSQSGGANKKYGYVYKTGGGDFMPFVMGSVLVQNACYSGVATPTFPNSTQNVKYEFYGYPEFTFIPD
jgi:hypothetical protein